MLTETPPLLIKSPAFALAARHRATKITRTTRVELTSASAAQTWKMLRLTLQQYVNITKSNKLLLNRELIKKMIYFLFLFSSSFLQQTLNALSMLYINSTLVVHRRSLIMQKYIHLIFEYLFFGSSCKNINSDYAV